MDQLICASLSHTHHWYEVGMLKVPAHVSLFSRKFWTSKLMYRGSAADFSVVLCEPRNPTTNATGDYTHLDNFLRLSGM